jgi:hypothetical protein
MAHLRRHGRRPARPLTGVLRPSPGILRDSARRPTHLSIGDRSLETAPAKPRPPKPRQAEPPPRPRQKPARKPAAARYPPTRFDIRFATVLTTYSFNHHKGPAVVNHRDISEA